MRYTVLTYIFNGYEQVHEIREKDPEADYVLVTNNPRLKSDSWRVVVKKFDRRSAFGKCYEVRFHPFRYAKTPVVVRVDGSIELRKSLKPLVDAFEEGEYDRCLMIHPHRNTFPEEYEVWVKSRGYPLTQSAKCLMLMQRMGYDFGYKGLYQGCFEILRDNQVNKDVQDMTFGLLCALGTGGKIERIDQTITSFVLNRFFEGRIKVMPVEEDIITDGKMMQWYIHNSMKPIDLKTDKIEARLFNRKVKK